MIMKFDHISYIAIRQEKDIVKDKFADYHFLFKEEQKKNLDIKKKLMHEEQLTHDFYFFEGQLPVEIIFYDKVFLGEQIHVDLERNIIYAKGRNLAECESILKGIGFEHVFQNENKIVCNMRGVFDKKDYWLVVEKAENIKVPYLDDVGFGCVALMIDNADKVKILGGGYEKEEIIVNGRQLEVCFLRVDALNVIFEFIMPKRGII